jgi:DNA gyrase subunit A
VKTISITEKTGNLMAIKNVTDDDDLMIITQSGMTIRMHVADIRVMGRAAQGVRLINLKGKEVIAAVAQVPRSEDEEENGEMGDDLDNGTVIDDNGTEE